MHNWKLLFSDVNEKNLGKCGSFEEKQVGDERFFVFQGAAEEAKGETCTIILRGGAEQVEVFNLFKIHALVSNGYLTQNQYSNFNVFWAFESTHHRYYFRKSNTRKSSVLALRDHTLTQGL